MFQPDGTAAELWSSVFLYGGIGLMAGAAVLGAAALLLLRGGKKRLEARLETEFGRKRS